MSHIEYKKLEDIDLRNEFFQSLRDDYAEFDSWYQGKSDAGEKAYVLYSDESNTEIVAFVYLKMEHEEHTDITPVLPKNLRLKVGTLKVNAHGTKLGDRIIKKIMDTATENGIDEVYVTVFNKHQSLITLLDYYGFQNWGVKESSNGTELVYIKNIGFITGNIYKDYPYIDATKRNFWVLGIHPVFHTRLFPDSILNNESYDLLTDIAPTNTIKKVYIAAMPGIRDFAPRDIVLIYRTSDGMGPARFRSVITSICVVDEIRMMSEFDTLDKYLDYCRKGSIFSENELRQIYRQKKYPFVIRMSYNISLKKRVTNGQMIDDLGINPDYWGVFGISSQQFNEIMRIGEANSSLVNI